MPKHGLVPIQDIKGSECESLNGFLFFDVMIFSGTMTAKVAILLVLQN